MIRPALFDIIDALAISLIHIGANNRCDEAMFLVCASESGYFKGNFAADLANFMM